MLRSSAIVLLLAACSEGANVSPADGAGTSPYASSAGSSDVTPPSALPQPGATNADDSTRPSPSGGNGETGSGSAGPQSSAGTPPGGPAVPSGDSAEAGTSGGDSAGEGPAVDAAEQPSPSDEDSAVIDELAAYLEQERAAREPLSEQAFARAPLSKEQAQQAAQMLWDDHVALIAESRRSEHDARSITLDGQTLRYDFTVFGEAPAGGRSLYISLHGGGNAEPSVNDQQWENQKVLYQPDEGIYLAPRAPTNTWNLWHEAHIDPLFARLIENLIVLENVNPDRVYVMGYSAGGDGVYQIGPRMADHWAAAAAMAGHPNEAQPFSLRNVGFTVHVGALDTGYDRNLVAQEWSDKLAQLQAEDPAGYTHVVEIHEGKPHWMDLEDAVAVPWMAQFTRDTTPSRVVWYQDDITHSRFYWLAVDIAEVGSLTEATIEGQTIGVVSDASRGLRVRLNDELLDLDQPVALSFNGVVAHSGSVDRVIATLAETLAERGDPRLMFSAEVPLD